jgi:sulfite oxidase
MRYRWLFRPLQVAGTCFCEEKVFTRKDLEKHKTIEDGIWVSYKTGVYDITDFIRNHPGGQDKVLLAAGKSIDPFWRIYQQHFRQGSEAMNILERHRIGTLDPSDVEQVDSSDPYASDPPRHPGLKFHGEKPCQAEIPPAMMMDSWVTPADLWFIRNHHPVPDIDVQEFKLSLDGLGMKEVKLSTKELRERFPATEVVSTLQCGGNRRSGLNAHKKTSGIAWGIGAISTARWKGVLLRDVLINAGMLTSESARKMGVNHIHFYGHDGCQASIPIEKALDPFGDVLLAYEMNGEPIPREHGFPLRVIVPGVVGIRNIKWVTSIRASDVEVEGPWQRGIAYKGFSPSRESVKDLDDSAIERVLSIQETPVQSCIVEPINGSKTELDSVTVRGFAYAGGGKGIVRVDVSIDGGENWVDATLGEGAEQNMRRAWAWTFWSVDIDIPESLHGKELDIVVKATDASYGCQPETPKSIWNLRGLVNNSWHHVRVQHIADD